MSKQAKGFFTDLKPQDYLLDKELAIESFVKYQLDRTQSMFQYKNLPDTLPQREIELMLQRYGQIFVTKVDGKLYAFNGGLGGEPDVYYRPTLCVVANPALKLSRDYVIGEDGILVRNDSYMWGLIPLLAKYGALLVENEISLRTIVIYLRIVALISASDDKTKASADKFMEKIIAGDLSVVGEAPFFDGVKVQSMSNSTASYIQQFIELEQYLKGSLYNELGLNANYNMKRESLTKNETTLNEDFLMPFCDDMLAQRKLGWDMVNEMFGTDISVEFSSTWKKRATLDVIEMEKAVADLRASQSQQSSQLDEEVNEVADTSVSDNPTDTTEDAVDNLIDTTVQGSSDDGIDSEEGSGSDENTEDSSEPTDISEEEEVSEEQSEEQSSDEDSIEEDEKKGDK